MLHGVPLTAGGRFRRIPPKEGLHGVLQAVGLLELLELPLLLGGRRRFLLDGRLLLPGGGGAAAAALLAGLFFGRGRRLGGATSLGLALLLLLGGWFEVPVVIRSVGVFFVLDSGTLPPTIAVAIRFGRGGSSGGGWDWFGVLLFDLFGYRTSRSRGLLFLLLLELPERDIVLAVTAAHNAVWYRPVEGSMCKIMGGDATARVPMIRTTRFVLEINVEGARCSLALRSLVRHFCTDKYEEGKILLLKMNRTHK